MTPWNPLSKFLRMLAPRRRYSFEFRHPSWYTPAIMRLLAIRTPIPLAHASPRRGRCRHDRRTRRRIGEELLHDCHLADVAERHSTDLYIQNQSPGTKSNWLPTPKGKCILMLRMYWPNEDPPSIIDGTWTPPVVKKSHLT